MTIRATRPYSRDPLPRHLAALRIQRAAEILGATDASLAEIAAAVGYANQLALSRAFRRHLGEPPGQFRRRIHAVTPERFTPRCLAA